MKQTHDHSGACIAPETGALLMQYELGKLSPSERESFERHLMDCDFCLHEASEMQAVADALLVNRREIAARYAAENTSVESLLALSADKPKLKPITVAPSLPKPKFFSWDALFGPKAAVAWAAAAALLIIVGVGVFRDQKPVAVGEYAPPSWYAWQSRSAAAADSLLEQAQQSYAQQDYQGARSSLSSYLEQHRDAQAALYLGVSRYELGQLDEALKALDLVDTSNQIVREEAQFYRAVILVRKNDRSGAMNILETLVATNSTRVEEARELLMQLKE